MKKSNKMIIIVLITFIVSIIAFVLAVVEHSRRLAIVPAIGVIATSIYLIYYMVNDN